MVSFTLFWHRGGAGLHNQPWWTHARRLFGASSWHQPGSNCACALHYTTPTAQASTAQHPSGLWTFFAGRLDNGDTLRDKLNLGAPKAGAVAAAELAGEALYRWGFSGAAEIHGDFALVAWDEHRQRLWAFRDAFGVVPLMHAECGDLLMLSTEATSLRELGLAAERVDAIGALAYVHPWFDFDAQASPFQGVGVVPPAHGLEASPGRVAVQRYWRLRPEHRIRYAHERDYLEHWRSVLQSAVQRRLPKPPQTYAVELSSGFDSTAVALAAYRLTRRQGGSPQRIIAITHGHPRLPECDEGATAQRFASSLGLRHLLIDGDAALQRHAACLSAVGAESPADLALPWVEEGLRSLQQWDAKVLLSGIGGDELCQGFALTWDLLRRGDAATYARWLAMLGRGTSRRLHKIVRRLHPARHNDKPDVFSMPQLFSLPPGMRVGAEARRAWLPMTRRGLRAQIPQHFDRNILGRFLPGLSRAAYAPAIAYAHPFLDRDVVEFATSIPARLWFAEGSGKRLLKADLLDSPAHEHVHRAKKVVHNAKLVALVRAHQPLIAAGGTSPLHRNLPAIARSPSHQNHAPFLTHYFWLHRHETAPGACSAEKQQGSTEKSTGA